MFDLAKTKIYKLKNINRFYKMPNNLILNIFIRSFVKFPMMDPEIQMKRAKRFIHTGIHTYRLTDIKTDYPNHNISINLFDINFILFTLLFN